MSAMKLRIMATKENIDIAVSQVIIAMAQDGWRVLEQSVPYPPRGKYAKNGMYRVYLTLVETEYHD